MKFSIFNVLNKIDDKTILFNTLHQGVLELDSTYSQKLEEYIKNNICDEDLYNNLIKGNFIVEDNIDEIKSYKLDTTLSRFDSTILSLTIAPTLECNFACTYCFEKGKRYNTMNTDTVSKLIEFVKNQMDNFSGLAVTWYGGEPLLCLDLISELTNQFKSICGEKKLYTSSIVTNGYLLNKDTAKKLRELSIEWAQVTLDGIKEIHDKRRFTIDKKGTFDVIVSNIKASCDIIPIGLRINIDKQNMNQSNKILDLIDENGLKNKINFYVAAVDDINETCTNTLCLNNIEFSKFETEFYKDAFSRGMYSAELPTAITSICGAVSLNSYVIDPLGDLYKCWNTIGYKEESLGNIWDGIKNKEVFTKWMAYEQIEDECETCSVSPLCSGGCPYYFVVSGKHKCRSCKNNLNDMIDLFYLKKNSEHTRSLTV